MMKTSKLKTRGRGGMFFLCLLLFLWGCVPVQPPAGGGSGGGGRPGPRPEPYVGLLHYNWGSNAFVNGASAGSGRRIYSGDNVSTGEATSVSVVFPDGGMIQLDADTDPDFRKWFEMGRCVVSAFFQFGQAYGETGSDCDILIEDEHLEALAHTRFNLMIRPNATVLTILEGRMTLRRPGTITLRQNDQAVVFADGRVERRRVSAAELKKIVDWRRGYPDKTGWCCASGRVFSSTPDACRRRRGVYGDNEKRVRAACDSPATESGYCCIDGKLSKEERVDCLRRKGNWYPEYNEARDRCQVQPSEGWCCSGGKVFRTSPDQCHRVRGVFSNNEEKIRVRCRQTVRPNTDSRIRRTAPPIDPDSVRTLPDIR